jgi:hypothetical protein
MKLLIVFMLGLLLRIAMILTFPVVWGGDTVIRLFDRHTLVKGHQLPMLQILISGVSSISMNPALVQYMMAVIGAIAGVGFYFVAADLFGEKWAFPAALLFATNPFITAVSTVPFQEILMLAGLLFAFHFFYSEKWLAASLCLAVACLTRYEAWAACPVLAIAYFWRKERSLFGALKAAALFGWPPVAWIVARHGLTSTGHYAVETALSIYRLQRYVYLGWITVKFTQLPALLLAAAGMWRLYRDRSRLDWRLWIQFAFVALFAIALFFSAHGVAPDPERYVTSREAHISIYLVLLLAALGLEQWPRWNKAILTIGVALGIAGAFWYAHIEASQPNVQLAYRTAKYLDRSLGANDRALILVKPLGEDQVSLYLAKVKQTGGEPGLREARREIEEIAGTPPDYQRLVTYSRLGRERLLVPPVGCAEWVAVWDDYPDAARELEAAQPVAVVRAESRSVTILRRQCGR